MPFVQAMASVLQACIFRTKNRFHRRRRGSESLTMNSITGMGGQLAALLWLRHIGMPARMLSPSPDIDAGFDIVCFPETGLKIEVKTSCFADGRGTEAMRHGDRLPFSRPDCDTSDFYFWFIAQPMESWAESIYFDLIVALPAGATSPWSRPFITPPGMRLRNIPAMFNHDFFVATFADALGPGMHYDFGDCHDVRSTLEAMRSENLVCDDGASPDQDVMRAAEVVFSRILASVVTQSYDQRDCAG
jgi:hypothetical protein